MGYRLRRRALAPPIVAGLMLLAASSSHDSGAGTLPPTSVLLTANADGILVDGDAVANGATINVALDQQIVLSNDAQGQLVAGDDVKFDLYMHTTMVLVAADRLGVTARLEAGHITGSVDEGADTRVHIHTPTGVVLTTLQPGTQFTVCQSGDGKTCLNVVSGEVEWQSAGETKTYVARQSAFGNEGEPPHPAVCVPPDEFQQWFDDARRNAASETLGQLVNGSPPCADVASSTTEPVVGSGAQLRTVPGNVAWTDTGIDVHLGDLVSIEAGGDILADVDPDRGLPTVGPDGYDDPSFRVANIPGLEGANHAALIGRIGDAGPPFLVGVLYAAPAVRDGRLFLGINDKGVENNSGAYTANIAVSSP